MLPSPEFPPLITGHAVALPDDPFLVAIAGAAAGELGAGDLCWSEAEDQARAAIVLEPDCPLGKALHMAPLLMVAIGDALGAIGPPNLALMYRWPFTLLANGGEVGQVLLRPAAGSAMDQIPAHIVLGFAISISHPPEVLQEPGLAAATTALHEEGCGDLDRSQILSAIARHFLMWIDTWQHDGLAAAHADFIGRMENKPGSEISALGLKGRMIGIDEDGGLLLDGPQGVRNLSLALALGITT